MCVSDSGSAEQLGLTRDDWSPPMVAELLSVLLSMTEYERHVMPGGTLAAAIAKAHLMVASWGQLSS